jgi:NADH:ubiquinone oxidoreductase subunit H
MPAFINATVIAHFVLIFIIFNCLVLSAAFMVWMERKVCAYIQDRPGPNRVGPEGLLQPFADVIKLLMKEDLRPASADTLIFWMAPVVSTIQHFRHEYEAYIKNGPPAPASYRSASPVGAH